MNHLATLRNHMNRHGLHDWSVRYLRRGTYRLYGICQFRKKVIGINRDFCDRATPEEIDDLCLHEIAHALNRQRNGFGKYVKSHGWQWRGICREIGAEPTRLYQGEVILRTEMPVRSIKYQIMYEDRVVASFKRWSKRLDNIHRLYIPGRKNETLGKLKLVKL